MPAGEAFGGLVQVFCRMPGKCQTTSPARSSSTVSPSLWSLPGGIHHAETIAPSAVVMVRIRISLAGIPARPDGTHYEGAGADLAAQTLVAFLDIQMHGPAEGADR